MTCHLHEQILVASTGGISVVDLVHPDCFFQTRHDNLTDQIQREGWHGKLLDVVHVIPDENYTIISPEDCLRLILWGSE